jgi:hypothetical protein
LVWNKCVWHSCQSGEKIRRVPHWSIKEREDDLKRGVSVVVGVAVACLVWASVAAAQSPATGGYSGAGGQVQGDVGGAGSGSLPFTGLDLVLVIGAGLLLVAAGFTMRRLSRAKG